MPSTTHQLAFERPIFELEARLQKLENLENPSAEIHDEIRRLRREKAEETRRIYSNLEPWETVEVARHPDRPRSADYLNLVFDEFMELHGDKCFGDDRAISVGFAKLDQYKVLFIGHEKGRTLKERTACNFGCAHPEGYRKTLAKMKLAEKFGLPVVTLIDTPGAYPGIGAEERGQAQIIATSILEMSRLRTPIICVVIGEGGSGGALGIGVGDRIGILQHSYYSVISPEGCSGILWKSGAHKEKAAKALKLTAPNLQELGVVDDIIDEPLGGAHRDHHQVANTLKMYLVRRLRELLARPIDALVNDRYTKFRGMGVFLDGALDGASQNTETSDGVVPSAAADSPSDVETS